MPYIGQAPTTTAFLTDQFSGNGSTTAFTMSVAPANTGSVLVSVTGVLQDPSTYSVNGTTLTFSAAPPTGTGNISVRYLGIPASGITTTAYRTVTEFTATANQTTFTPPSYTVGFINVYRNGVRLGASDYTASNGTTVVLAKSAASGDLVTTESFYVSSVLNAIPATAGAVNSTYLANGSVLAANMGANGTWAPAGTVLQVVSASNSTQFSTSSTSWTSTPITASITPKFSTSKILVVVTYCMYGTGQMTINRGATNLGNATYGFLELNNTTAYELTAAYSYLDSPATTSSTTYTVYVKGISSYSVWININPTVATITLIEVTA